LFQERKAVQVGDVIKLRPQNASAARLDYQLGTVVKVAPYGRMNTDLDVMVQVLWSDGNMSWVPSQYAKIVSEILDLNEGDERG